MISPHKFIRLAFLVGIATALHVLEGTLPLPFVIPGVKLGLANIVTLFTFVFYGLKEAFIVSLVRIFLGSLLSGTIFSVACLFSVSGSLCSILVIIVLTRTIPSLSLTGVSVMAAFSHNIGQYVIAVFLIQSITILYYLPLVILLSIPAGVITGLTTKILLQQLTAIEREIAKKVSITNENVTPKST